MVVDQVDVERVHGDVVIVAAVVAEIALAMVCDQHRMTIRQKGQMEIPRHWFRAVACWNCIPMATVFSAPLRITTPRSVGSIRPGHDDREVWSS